MEWYVIVVLVGYLLIVLLLNLKIIFYYENSEDSRSNQALVAKIVALAGLEIGWFILAGIPTDGFNVRHDGGLDMELYWQMIDPILLLFLAFPIPFATVFYEADSDPRIAKTSPWLRALKSAAIVFVGSALLFAILYFALRSSKRYICEPGEAPGEVRCSLQPARIPFFLFGWVILSFFGWFVTVLFLGIGLVATPLGLIVGFVHRPKPISPQEYSAKKAQLAECVVALKLVGVEMRAKEQEIKLLAPSVKKYRKQRKLNSDFNKFRQSVHLLENDFENLSIALKQRGENPLFSAVKLLGGIIATILSVCWVVHIILACLIPSLLGKQHGNGFFTSFLVLGSKANFYLVDLMLCAILIGYLLLCSMIGCFRFNMRTFCCCSIHPMKKGATHLNSILFNVAVVIVTAISVTHLAYDALTDYVRGGYIDIIFGQYAAYAPVVGVFFRNGVFEWLLIIWTAVCTVGLCAKPRESRAFTLRDIKKFAGKHYNNDTEGGGGQQLSKRVDEEVSKAVGKVEAVTKFLG